MRIQRRPEALNIFNVLKERIEHGDYHPGTWLPTERILAEEFTVDRSVVRRALSDLAETGLIIRKPGHRPWVREGAETAKGLPPASRLSAGVQTIAAILPQHTAQPATVAILRGINQALQFKNASCRLMIFDNYAGKGPVVTELERNALEAVEHEGIAGLLLWHMGGKETVPALRRLRAKNVPMVFVDRYPGEMEVDFVGVDNRFGAREAVNYLLSLGHRRIGHLSQDARVSAVYQRIEGYREALQMHHIPLEPELIYNLPFGKPAAADAVEHFFTLAEPPTALFVVNDSCAYEFMAKAEARGIRVPRDLSIIGFDDVERFSPRPAMLTTMQQPFELMGQHATELLLNRLAQKPREQKVFQHTLLPTPLLVRSTCKLWEPAAG